MSVDTSLNTSRNIPWNAKETLQIGNVQEWARCLYDISLIALPCWGGGKALPGTSYRELADNPPSRSDVGEKDYSGGLSILLGTKHVAGGFVIGFDIDRGPVDHFPWADDFLMLEAGTAPGKWHLYLCSKDRLNGQINLRDSKGDLVAEIKGYGKALRSWPTRAEGKPRGYRVLAITDRADNCNPKLTAVQLAEALSDYLSYVLQERIFITNQNNHNLRKLKAQPLSENLHNRIMQELECREVHLKPGGKGWLQGKCPFHEDANPSFSVSFELNSWRCWAGCGSGSLRNLAWRLGIHIKRHGHHKARLITAWEVRG